MFRAYLLASVLAISLPACVGDDPVPAPAPTSTETEEARTPRPTRSPDRPFDPDDIAIDLRPVAQGFDAPIGLVRAPGNRGRMYVIEQPGRIRSFTRAGTARTFLDISDRISAGGERGLLGLAFHPNFTTNFRFYVNYTNLAGDTVVSEYRTRGRAADPSSERVLLTIDQPFANHNGGQLAFGWDDYLYIATGDGGSAGDPHNNGQRLDTLLGKILRIDVDGDSAGEYGIPRDNPFIERDAARPEIWAFGLRNPWRFSFDRSTGDLWIADVGQSAYEEVDREPRDSEGGQNYGWRVVEGASCYESGCDADAFVDPVMTYSHEYGCSITGGYVYRGEEFPSLQGAYLAADYCSGNVWAIDANERALENPAPILDTEFSIASFGEDAAGELYLADAAGGTVYQVTARRR